MCFLLRNPLVRGNEEKGDCPTTEIVAGIELLWHGLESLLAMPNRRSLRDLCEQAAFRTRVAVYSIYEN
jgi:hypothetical protein